MSCFIVCCNNSHRDSRRRAKLGKNFRKLIFHRFPKDIVRRDMWTKTVQWHAQKCCGKSDGSFHVREVSVTSSSQICSDHFVSADYNSAIELEGTRRLLMQLAIPSVFHCKRKHDCSGYLSTDHDWMKLTKNILQKRNYTNIDQIKSRRLSLYQENEVNEETDVTEEIKAYDKTELQLQQVDLAGGTKYSYQYCSREETKKSVVNKEVEESELNKESDINEESKVSEDEIPLLLDCEDVFEEDIEADLDEVTEYSSIYYYWSTESQMYMPKELISAQTKTDMRQVTETYCFLWDHAYCFK